MSVKTNGKRVESATSEIEIAGSTYTLLNAAGGGKTLPKGASCSSTRSALPKGKDCSKITPALRLTPR